MTLALSKHFGQTYVFTTSNRNILAQDKSITIDEGLIVHEIKTNDYRTVIAKKSKSTNSHFSEEKKSGLIQRVAIKSLNTSPINRLFGEGGNTYVQDAVDKAKKIIVDQKITHIYSSFRPYADHYIAFKLKAIFPELKWIADFRDMHVEPLYKNVLFPKRQLRINKKLFARADVITTVTPSFVEHFKQYNKNAICVYNGLFRNESALIKTNNNSKTDKKLKLIYTGSLYGEERNPSVLFEALNKLEGISSDNIKIYYAGKDGTKMSSFAINLNAEIYLEIRGQLSRMRALELQNNADVLLLLSSSVKGMQGILTGKFFEYIQTGKPIWLIIKGDFDPYFEELFEQYNLGKIFYIKDGTENIELAVKEYLHLREHDLMHELGNDIEKINTDFNWDVSAKKILNSIP